MTIILSESIDLSEAQINTERRQIQGVVLIKAGMSLNKRNYSEDVLRKAVPVFEGAKAYVDHGTKRSFRDLSGWYENVRFDNGKLIADRTFTRNQAGQDVWAVAEDILAGRAPKSLAGLSINAVGTAKKHDTQADALEIESITAALSVDDVDNAAAGGSYRESSTSGDDLTKAFWEALTFKEWRDARPDFVNQYKESLVTARQDDAIKTVRAESEEALKAARAETESALAALKEAQAEIETWRAKYESALEARRVEAIESALSRANVPADWKKPLRESLLKADESAWAGLIETEEQKARSAGHRTPVTGAAQQVNAPLKEAPKLKNAPYDMSKVQSPDDFLALLQGD